MQVPGYFITQKDWEMIEKVWSKEMSMIEFLWQSMGTDLQVEVDKEMRKRLKDGNS